MAYLDELQTLTDMVASLQRQLNDISVTVSGYRTEIDDNTDDIDDLQNPPSAVPPGLLSWLNTPHSIREVDTQLDTDLDTLTTDIAAAATDISVLTIDLATETSDRIAADTAFTATDLDLQTQITDNLATLTQEVSDRGELSVIVSQGLDAVNDRVDDVQSDLSALSTSSSTSSASLSSQISSITQSLQLANTKISLLEGSGVDPMGAQAAQITDLTIIANDAQATADQEVIDRTNADTILQNSIDTLNSSISGLVSGLNTEVSDRQAADSTLAADIAAIEALAAGNDALITAEEAARVAADATLTTNVATNATDITNVGNDLATEIADREAYGVATDATLATNSANIATNTANIVLNTADILAVEGKFSVVKDGSGYVTDWRDIGEVGAAGDFKLRDLNNDARIYAPGFAGKYFPAVSVISFSPAVTYDTDWGGGTNTDFQGTDLNNYTRAVKVFSTLSVGINGSCFLGVDNSTGGSLQRLGQVLTTFLVQFSGGVNRYLSLWYRIKDAPADITQRWFPVALADNTIAGARTYEQTSLSKVVQISVTSDKVIEFGLTALNTLDATIADAANDLIYGGSVTVSAYNMVTIA